MAIWRSSFWRAATTNQYSRAILKNPPILILDEAASAPCESKRWYRIRPSKLMKTRTYRHCTPLVVNADEIYVSLHEGRIVEQGTHDDLILKDGYYKYTTCRS